MRAASWVDIVEATYDLEQSEEPWLRGITDASQKLLDEGLGLFAFLYDAAVPERMTIQRFVHTPTLAGLDAGVSMVGIEAAGGGAYVRETFCKIAVETVRNTPGSAGSPAEAIFDAKGLGDIVVINGVDPGGLGSCMGVIARKPTTLSRSQRQRYARIATHLATSYRLRRRLGSRRSPASAPWDADAVLSPRGHMEHAETPDVETKRAREALREAAVAIDRARGKLRRIDADSALGQWMGLVDSRWSLVDKFDRDGKRFVLARRNDASVSGLDLLTERERAVAAYAALGHTNKHIAYDLGIAHSTVRVLLARAAAKMGARSREELVAVVRAASAPPS